MDFYSANNLEERLHVMRTISEKIRETAALIDKSGEFPVEFIEVLKKSGYTSLTVPKRFGGGDLSLLELVQLQEQLATGDGSTALSIGWHMGIIKNLEEKKLWDDSLFESVCKEILKGALINAAASEAQTGSPTRGGRPGTTAVRKDAKWVMNGRKTFTTMSPVLDYFIVSASIPDSGEVGNFLITRDSKGVSIEETWDSIAMRGTGSHDLILKDVEIPEEHFVEKFKPASKRANGWLLHIPACYLGIAQAAQTYAINFAKQYSPNSIEGTIAEIPAVRQKIGEMELKLMNVRYFLYGVADRWDQSSEQERDLMKPELGAVKMAVTNASIEVVDLAMRIVGARSLSASNPLQRYYRDVRAGLHNPPMDDMTIEILAKNALNKY